MTDTKRVKVVIAGGGTAGWVTAAALTKQLGDLLDITLVESDQIGTIGVGEATIPTHRSFHRLIGLDEREFMKATQATFKLGISFENWGQIGDRYFHSFGEIGKSIWMGGFLNMYLQAKELGFGGSLDDYSFELQAAAQNKFYTAENSALNYAYHLDSSLYAKLLREISVAGGVTRIEGLIKTVEQDSMTGDITKLHLISGEVIEGDFFVDCTGFRGVLIEQTLKTGYEDWTEWLPTNRAVAVQADPDGPAIPYTRAIAHEAGWQWKIPLQHRIGTGLVYCDKYMSDDEATSKLLGSVKTETLTEPKLIRYKTGKRKKSWNKNCVAFGLSAGFLEPLESTSIHLVQIGVTRLIQLFPFGKNNASLRQRFNEQTALEQDSIKDFIILHYKATQRDDTPFWNHCREMSVPQSLAGRIAGFRENALVYQDGHELFKEDSWVQVLIGQGVSPEGFHKMGRLLKEENLRNSLKAMSQNIQDAVVKLPLHEDFLTDYLR